MFNGDLSVLVSSTVVNSNESSIAHRESVVSSYNQRVDQISKHNAVARQEQMEAVTAEREARESRKKGGIFSRIFNAIAAIFSVVATVATAGLALVPAAAASAMAIGFNMGFEVKAAGSDADALNATNNANKAKGLADIATSLNKSSVELIKSLDSNIAANNKILSDINNSMYESISKTRS